MNFNPLSKFMSVCILRLVNTDSTRRWAIKLFCVLFVIPQGAPPYNRGCYVIAMEMKATL